MEGLFQTFENRLKEFLKRNPLNLEVPAREVDVNTLKQSTNRQVIGDYVIANDFPLATEGTRVALANKEGSDQLLVVKETTDEKMGELAELNQWERLTAEEHLQRKGFNDPNVLLPVKTITLGGKIYRFYQAMDTDLEQYFKNHNRFSIRDGIILILQGCRGIYALHKAGVANIDFAPLNIMLTSTSLKLIDLDGASIEKTGGTLSRNYPGNNRFTASPELLENKPYFDKTVDVYAAAATLYRVIVGYWPYNIEEHTAEFPIERKLDAYKNLHKSGEINFPNFVPLEIQKIIKRGMSPRPKDRYQTIQEFMSELMKFLEKQ
jgi:hypothetical protein